MSYRTLPVSALRRLAESSVGTMPDREAQFTLGQRYARGIGVQKNETEAAKWFLKAADAEHERAQRYLAFAYLHGRGVERNVSEGIRRLRIAAEWGDAPSQRQLGFHYATGNGIARDETKGMHWFLQAANQGDYLAQYNLAVAYANGSGVEKEPTVAFHWYELAATQGMPEAQCALALAYEHGIGVALDYAKSAYWNRLAANKNYAEACSNLGWLYENGLGVEQDLEHAQRLYELAARQEYSEASVRLCKLRERHSSDHASQSEPLLHRDESIKSYIDAAFEGLVGLEVVRQEVFRQASYIHVQKLRAQLGLRVPHWPSRHLIFLGNPGTGKTTIARIFAGLYKRLGIVKTDKVVETDRAGLVAPYIGQTALKTKAVVESALGGILFIDEAYALARSGPQDFGKEAIETLLKLMEDHRDDLVVIVAGYTAEMESFIESNPGLASRLNRYVHFPDYSPQELLDILLNFCKTHSYVLSTDAHAGLLKVFRREILVQRERFGNARYVRNLFERMIEAQALRVYEEVSASKSDLQQILCADVQSSLGEVLPSADGLSGNYEAVLSRLNQLVGLERVKKQVQRLFDFVHVQHEREVAGSKTAKGFSQHLVFTGNPGTGKTAVARIVADLYFSLGIISSNRIVEVDRSGLVAGYVGQSAIKTLAVVKSALGGVLFIDEAYALAPIGGENDFGSEVIDTLLKAMEDHRGELMVIVAGYSQPMQRFIDSNPGFRSRFNHHIEFDDYTPAELLGIFEAFCKDAQYALDARDKSSVLAMFQRMYESGHTVANARLARNIFERSIEVQSGRLSKLGLPSQHIDLDLLTGSDLRIAIEEIEQEQFGAQFLHRMQGGNFEEPRCEKMQASMPTTTGQDFNLLPTTDEHESSTI